jgi:hypothetical protein
MPADPVRRDPFPSPYAIEIPCDEVGPAPPEPPEKTMPSSEPPKPFDREPPSIDDLISVVPSSHPPPEDVMSIASRPMRWEGILITLVLTALLVIGLFSIIYLQGQHPLP